MNESQRLRHWLRRAAPPRSELLTALAMASIASVAASGLFVGAVALLVVSAQRPGLRAIAVFLIAIELTAFLRSPLRYGERMSAHRLGFAAVTHWRQWLMAVVGAWEFSRWQRYAAGDLLERALTDTDELQDLWLRGVIPAAASLLTMLVGDATVGVLAPLGHWWGVALGLVLVHSALVSTLVRRSGAQFRADRELRARRGDYVASLVSSRTAAPEINLLGAHDFVQRRDDELAATLARAESTLARERRRDGYLVVVGPLAGLGLVGALHPASAAVWIVVAALIAAASAQGLATVRTSLQVAVAVTGGAERLDELAGSTTFGDAPWPSDHTLVFREVTVARGTLGVRRVSGTARSGQRLALRGPSGSGKSTLLRALARLDTADAAEISVGGIALADIAEDQLRQRITLVPSEPGLLRGYVRDVVGLGVEISRDEMDALAELGLPVDRNDFWEDLSRGERQRAALVRALARRPQILLLDEPTSALGDHEAALVLSLLARCPATLIVASHDPRVLTWCDNVLDFSDAPSSQAMIEPRND